MIPLFEEITFDLKDIEKYAVAPFVAGMLKQTTFNNPKKGAAICRAVQSEYQIKFSEARLRKVIGYIRHNRLLENKIVGASSKGYFATSDPSLIKKCIDSIEQRAAMISAVADAMKKQFYDIQNQQND